MILYGLAASYHQSLMTPEPINAAVSSTRLRCIMGENKGKKNPNKTEHQDRAKLTTEKKKC